jgi:methylated-DNA-[protein]-cysteine S-methyltransferase
MLSLLNAEVIKSDKLNRMSKILTTYYKSPVGEMVIGSYKDKLCLCDWRHRSQRETIDHRILTGLGAEFKEEISDITRETLKQLTEYFRGKLKFFNLPILLVGSDFQKRVWNELMKIPWGTTETYLGLTRRLGDEKAIRAVAAANGANAMAIIVPCHRIIGTNGKLTGYAGGLRAKMKLLELERNGMGPGQLELF